MPHLDAAYDLARWLVRHDHDAEDVVQEVFFARAAVLSRVPDIIAGGGLNWACHQAPERVIRCLEQATSNWCSRTRIRRVIGQ
jgi:hypothetical protein